MWWRAGLSCNFHVSLSFFLPSRSSCLAPGRVVLFVVHVPLSSARSCSVHIEYAALVRGLCKHRHIVVSQIVLVAMIVSSSSPSPVDVELGCCFARLGAIEFRTSQWCKISILYRLIASALSFVLPFGRRRQLFTWCCSFNYLQALGWLTKKIWKNKNKKWFESL